MNTMRKIIAAVLMVCLLCPMGVFANSEGLKDVAESDWFYGYVTNVTEKNFLEPTKENTFDPERAITRAEFAAALGRLFGVDAEAYKKSSFLDVNISDWYAPYVEWAFENGIVTGTKSDAFSPSLPISREQAATIIWRAMGKSEYIVSSEELTKYPDAEKISQYAVSSVKAATNAGILKGDSKGFNPAGNITRAEAAAVITRLEEYIENRKKTRILNAEDQRKITVGIKALKKPIKEDVDLAKDIYTVAFSKNFSLTGSAAEILDKTFAARNSEEIKTETVTLMEMVATGLYGGTKIENIGGRYFGEKKAKVLASDFVIGDILVIEMGEKALMYIFDGKEFSLLKYQTDTEAVDNILNAISLSDRFVVLRPSYVMHELNESLPYKEEELTAAQKAVVETAENYLLRGYRVQYSDTRLGPWPGEFRWHFDEKAPEDYTFDEWGYTNCAAFATDVHRNALGYKSALYATWHLAAAKYMQSFYYNPTGKETALERQKIEEDFNKNLAAGDIIVIRRHDDSGHAMLYAGNGTIIHSGGSNYNYTKREEKYEPSIRYLQVKDLFTPFGGERRFIFAGQVSEVTIVRPIGMWYGEFPEDSLKRIENLKGIVAEKLSSHTISQTVSPGEEMTFTFSIYNANDHEVTLSVTDEVPENTIYVSGADKVEGKNLSWKVTIPENETVLVSYKVKVEMSAKMGDKVVSESGRVGGVPVNSPVVTIAKSLSENQKEKLSKALEDFEVTSENPVENVNAIYEKAFSLTNVLSANTIEELSAGIFEESAEKAGYYNLKETGKHAQMVAPSLIGGRKIYSSAFEYKVKGINYRTRLVRENRLIAGDIILEVNKESKNLYLYTGDGLIDLKSGQKIENPEKYLEGLLGSQLYFAVLRPSMIMN